MSTISKAMLSDAGFTSAVKADIQRVTKGAKFFTVEFIKDNGERRVMMAQITGKHVKGTGKPVPPKFNRLTVWDCAIKAYRTIPIDRLIRVTMGGKTTYFK